jgi:hypothetical protein
VTPNPAFDGLKPLEVIEGGEIERLWTMIFYLESGVASRADHGGAVAHHRLGLTDPAEPNKAEQGDIAPITRIELRPFLLPDSSSVPFLFPSFSGQRAPGGRQHQWYNLFPALGESVISVDFLPRSLL